MIAAKSQKAWVCLFRGGVLLLVMMDCSIWGVRLQIAPIRIALKLLTLDFRDRR
jgi:hypothetical protein